MASQARLRQLSAPREKSDVARKEEEDTGSRGRDGKKRGDRGRSDALVLGLVACFACLVASAHYFYHHLPPPDADATGRDNVFSTGNARAHLEAITALGVRHAGSPTNDALTRDLVVSAVQDIRRAASEDVEIEISVQQPSGSFFLDFLGGLTQYYDNLTNVVVRYSRRGQVVKDALLINCHFDSALGAIAASDDAVSCAILLETLRCLSSPPSPALLDHALIFLFNGAEEMILPASHGFVTQHQWAGQVRAFVNLEAAGSGGREVVFQTGPKHPWLAKLYAKAVPYPHGSVFAQEVFQSGVIPSDTDFRIFRDFGNIPGIDMAYFVNGYVYHTT